MWLWVIVALLCLLLLILLILCIPLELILSITLNESPTYKLRLLWLFGLLDRELKKTPGEPKQPTPKEKVTKLRRKQKRWISLITIYRIARIAGLWQQLKQLAVGIFTSLKIRELTANLKLGLESPADTAWLFAIAGPANFFFSLLPHQHQITISPSFEGDLVFDASVHSIVRLWPILVVFALLKFVFSLPAMRVAVTFVAIRWKRA